jgi:hypothetical protein
MVQGPVTLGLQNLSLEILFMVFTEVLDGGSSVSPLLRICKNMLVRMVYLKRNVGRCSQVFSP